jgi:segregation and condensation protein B
MSEIGLLQIVEGALLAAGKPLTVAQLGDLFEDAERPDNTAIRAALEEAAARCEGRGFELQEVASGFRYQVRQSLSPWVARLWQERPQKYSRALLETLALIAYRQPITRGEIEEIRGVAVSSNIIKTLHEREWIRVVGHRDVPGRPAMYATTRQFLDYFNLKTLDQLPALADIRDLETLNSELGFSDPVPGAGDADAAGGSARGLTLVGGTEHLAEGQPAEPETGSELEHEAVLDGDAPAVSDTPQDSAEQEDAVAERDTTAMDLAVTAADLMDDDAGLPEADEEGASAADACDLAGEDADSAAAGPDGRA